MKTDNELIVIVNELKSGHEDKFNELYEKSYKYLHTCVINIVKNEEIAQDMLQDTYVEIFRKIDQLKNVEDFMPWAATIANRKCFAYIKKNKDILVDNQQDADGNEQDYFENIADDEAFIPENIFDNKEKIKIIRDIINSLSDIQRACVIGFYYNNQKQEQIAEELGIPVNTVKSHLNRAKAKIKEAVGDVEKKQGIKLFSIVPFMLGLFGLEMESFAAECTVPAMSDTLSGVVLNSIGTTSKVSGSVIKSAGIALKGKIIIGSVASVIVIGIGLAIGIISSRDNTKTSEQTNISEVMVAEENADVVEEANNDKVAYIDDDLDYNRVIDLVTICDMPLATLSRDDIEQYFENKASGYYSGQQNILRDDEKEYNSDWFISKGKFLNEWKNYENDSYGYNFDGYNIMFTFRTEWGKEGLSGLRILQDDTFEASWMIDQDGRDNVRVNVSEHGRGDISNLTIFTNKAYGLSKTEFVDSVYPGAKDLFDSGKILLIFNNGFIISGDIFFEDVDRETCRFNHVRAIDTDKIVRGLQYQWIDDIAERKEEYLGYW